MDLDLRVFKFTIESGHPVWVAAARIIAIRTTTMGLDEIPTGGATVVMVGGTRIEVQEAPERIARALAGQPTDLAIDLETP